MDKKTTWQRRNKRENALLFTSKIAKIFREKLLDDMKKKEKKDKTLLPENRNVCQEWIFSH